MFSFISNFKQHCLFRSSHPELFLGKGAPKIRSKFTREHSCRSAISIKLLCNIIKIALRHGCSPVNLLHIFRTPFLKNIRGRLLLSIFMSFCFYTEVSLYLQVWTLLYIFVLFVIQGCLCSSTLGPRPFSSALGPQNIASLNAILLFNFAVVITLEL